MRDGTDPGLPSPLEFVGLPNRTHSPFHFTPDVYPVNGTKAVAGEQYYNFLSTMLMTARVEHVVLDGSKPSFQLYFSVY